MPIITSLLFIFQLCVISGAPVYASQSTSLATTEAASKTSTDALLEAVRRKEATSDETIALINKGADVNAIDRHGNTPLLYAAYNGLADVCITLIHKSANVNAKSQSGWTPLVYAAYNGLADVCITLIDEDADVNAIDQSGRTSLTWATSNGHRDVCISLLRHLLLKQLLAADPEGGNLATRKLRMLCAILTLKKTTISNDLIPLIIKSEPLMHDYTACRYDTYCCCPRLNEYHHAITRDQLYNLLEQGNIDTLKAAMQDACNACGGNNSLVLKNLLNPVDFNQHFDELFLRYIPIKPTMGE
jgi:hypothetical protein